MKTCFSLFSGCGGSDSGMIDAGYYSTGGIEWHDRAADIFDLNHQIKITRSDILNIDKIPTVDLLWMSPVCTSFSIANTNRGEKHHDINMATHIAKLAIESMSRNIAIENVRAYRDSASLGIILNALKGAGYTIDVAMYNAADYGTPSTRQRMIVRASLDSINPVPKTHQKPTNQVGMFDLSNWVSWLDVVKDRIHELPKSRLTENQSKSIENYHDSNQRILIERVGYYNGNPKIYSDLIPSPTIRSAQHIDDHSSYRVALNIIDNYECLSADIRCLSDWQGFPRNYNWGENKGESGRAIGNAVPPPLAKAIALSFENQSNN